MHTIISSHEGKRMHPCYDRYYASPALLFAAAGGDLEHEDNSTLQAIDAWYCGERPIDYRLVLQNLSWSQLQKLSDWYYSPDIYHFDLYLIDGYKSISIWCFKSPDGTIICNAPDGSRFTAVLSC